ncbi:MAG TPA: TldD/PmbA family protein [Armatimonadota bacterium]|jgi:predicted Zn-dependent protease
MMDRPEIEQICHLVLEESGADQTEVLVSSGQTALTRYANNRIHQNVAETDLAVSIRAIKGRQIGVSSTNDPRHASLRQATQRALELAELSPANPAFPGLPSAPAPEPGPAPAAATIASTPEERGAAVMQILDVARGDDLTASGALEADYTRLAVANSEGIFAYGEYTRAHLTALLQGADSSGWAETHATDISRLDPLALARTAAGKTLVSAAPRAVDPGPYTVILEPLAVCDILFWLGLYGFNALGYQEKRSFLTERLGQQVAAEAVSLHDDGRDERGLPLLFDFEGVPKQRVPLIDSGVAVGMVHDSRTAAHAEPPTTSTGHALPAPNTYGPVPTNLFLAPGDADMTEMIRSVDRGLLVTRFHYTNIVHPMQMTLTGMTRDGTFLIEDGEIMAGVKNLRFTQSLLEALMQVEMIGNEGAQGEYAWAPALKIAGFNFTGATEF